MVLPFQVLLLSGFVQGKCKWGCKRIVYPIVMGMSIENVDRSQRTSALGIHQSFYAVGMFTGPWLNGIIADRFGIRRMFLFTATFYFLAVYFFIYLLSRKHK